VCSGRPGEEVQEVQEDDLVSGREEGGAALLNRGAGREDSGYLLTEP